MENEFKCKICLTKSLSEELESLPELEYSNIIKYLSIVNVSENPLRYGYRTISHKLGDYVFFIDKFVLLAKINNNGLKIFKLFT